MSLIENGKNGVKKYEVNEKLIQYIKFILGYIEKICKIKYESNDTKSFKDIIQENDLLPLKEIIPKKSHIMKIDSFDKTKEYYSYIIPFFKNNMMEIKNSHNALNLKKYLYKDLIDICNLINKIIEKNEKYIEDNIIKFYAFHIINIFNEDKKKMESSKIFFKMGQIALRDKYQIHSYENFFPQNIKIKEYNEFLSIIHDLIKECQNIYNDKIKEDMKFIDDNFYSEMSKKKIEIENEINNSNQISKHLIIHKLLLELDALLIHGYKIKKLIPYKELIDSVLSFYNEMDEYDISYTLCFIDINKEKKSLDRKKEDCPELKKSAKIYDGENFNKMVLYLLKFIKYDKLKSVLNNKNSSLAQEFKEIIADEEFQKKVNNFFKSNSVYAFLKKKLEKRISCKINEKYKEFLNYLYKKKFWDSIMFFTLPKKIKGFVSSYMRIVLNDNFIIFNNCESKEDKSDMLRFLLFEIIIHELLHLLRRYFLIGIESKDAMTPLGSEESKKNKKYGEIGETLIKYFFGVKRINFLTLRQAKKFKNLTFETEEDIDDLKKIISLEESPNEESTYIKFLYSNCDISNLTYAKSNGGCLLSFRD